ncbi:hypothetical protein Tco_0911859 [Tanacetum coccineum]
MNTHCETRKPTVNKKTFNHSNSSILIKPSISSMDQENPQQNIPYESISSSMPTFESFTSQQNVILEDETIVRGDIAKKIKTQKKSHQIKNRKQCYEDWVMHKRIINFRPIHSHRGVDIGRALLECITEGVKKNVITVTVDNVASNDKAIEYLVENLPTKYDNDTKPQDAYGHVANSLSL